MPRQAQSFDGLLEALPDALVGADESGVIRLVNRQAESLFGYDRAELVGEHIEMLLPESFREVHAAHRVEYDQAPTIRPMGRELRLSGLRRDGTEIPVDVALSPMDTGQGVLVIASVRDMTYYRGAEAARRRAGRLLAIVEHSDDAIVSESLGGIVTSWNPGAERIYGYSSQEIIGSPATLLAPESRAGEIATHLARVRGGESVDHLQTERVRKDGTLFAASISITPIRDDDGAIVGASTIARDVSEARRAFEAARSMIEASMDALVAISPEGKITDANEATVQLTGVPRDQLIGTSFSDYFTDPHKADKVYQQEFGDAVTPDYQLTLRHHNGRETITEVLYNASAYRDPGGKVLGVFAAARDVTDQRKAAQYARSLVEATLEALVAISPDGRVTDANGAMVQLTGVPRHRLLGTSFSDYFTDPSKADAVYQQVFEKGRVTDYPLTLRHIDDEVTEKEVLYNASVYRDINGTALGVVATARDVTPQVQAQRVLEQQQAQERDRLEELERFQQLTVGRELKMIELKKEIEYLRKFGTTEGRGPDQEW